MMDPKSQKKRRRRKDKSVAQPTPRQLGALAANEGKPLSANPYLIQNGAPIDGRHDHDGIEWRRGWWEQRDRMNRLPGEPEIELETIRDSDGHPVKVARYGDDQGTPELHEREDVYKTYVRETGREIDAGSGQEKEVTRMRPVQRARDLMGSLHKHGRITLEEMQAGRRFRADFEIAQLDPRRAPDIRRVGGGNAGGDDTRKEEAAERVARAMEALGGHGHINGQCAWWVLGVGLSVGEWGEKKVFGVGPGISEKTARKIVVATVGLLKAHYERARTMDQAGN